MFDALTSRRPYKLPFSLEHTLELMLSERGRHFDPNLLDIFQSLLPDLMTTANNEKEMPKIVFQLADLYLSV
ncbi:MAG TPA: hypothetical protein DCS88_02195 [Alphaproteobacteria bacterium]|nr:hypothetical protein [Alphaproteobacteria bacterium]